MKLGGTVFGCRLRDAGPQNHDAEAQGHLAEAQDHLAEAQGLLAEAQGHLAEAQGLLAGPQGHLAGPPSSRCKGRNETKHAWYNNVLAPITLHNAEAFTDSYQRPD